MGEKRDQFEIACVVSRCEFPGLNLTCRPAEDSSGSRLALRVEATVPCAATAQVAPQYGRWWNLSLHMTDGEVAQTALMAVLAFHEHEVREHFKVDGVAVFGPHFDLDRLIEMASAEGAVKERS